MAHASQAIVERLLPDAEATRALGAELARACAAGTVVLLTGPLGAGKTTLVDGFVAELGAGRATSPSFVLAQRYDGGRAVIWHLDLYRLDKARDIEDLDLDLYTPKDGIALIEWADRAPDHFWPPDRVRIALTVEGSGRRAQLMGLGRGAGAVMACITAPRIGPCSVGPSGPIPTLSPKPDET